MPVTIQATLRTLTPLFIGGASPRAEWRMSSLKGALRFWYRAVAPEHAHRPPRSQAPTAEERIFGGTQHGSGQAAFLVRGDLRGLPAQRVRWEDLRVDRFRQGEGRHARNGLLYLGFPFPMKGNEGRDAIPPGTELPVQVVVLRDNGDPELRHALLGSLWLLGTLGGLGMRSRRGFGALSLTDWTVGGTGPHVAAWQQDRDALPFLHCAASPAAWMAGLRDARAVLQGRWFGPFDKGSSSDRERPQPHLGPAAAAVLLAEGFAADKWPEALNLAGRTMQDFRVRKPPDYQDVKDHISRRRRLVQAPGRVSFGLPLTFRYGSLPRGQNSLDLAPAGSTERSRRGGPTVGEERAPSLDRHASPLLIRPVTIGGRLHPLFLRLDGAVPGAYPPAVVRREGTPLRPGVDLMDVFLREIAQKGVSL